MTKAEAKTAIDTKIKDYKEDLKSPLAYGYEDQIKGIVTGLREAKKIINKINSL